MPAGTIPLKGFVLPDGVWLLGIAAGTNHSAIKEMTATGSGATTAFQLPANFAMFAFQTVPAGSGINLPSAFGGTWCAVTNTTSTALAVYISQNINVITKAPDTVNGSSVLTGGIPGNSGSLFFCAVDGVWISVPSGSGGSASARVQRSITSGGNLPVTGTDSILNINAVSDLTPTVPLASTRQGSPLTFKNLPGGHTQTLTATGPNTFDGQTTLALVAGSAVTLVPYNDGVNAGYAIE